MLAGGFAWALEHRAAHPTAPTSLLLLTDGEASGCVEPTAELAALVAEHYDAWGIATYVVGFDGVQSEQLEIVASAGGTDAVFLTSGRVEQDLIGALSEVATRSSGCEFPLARVDGAAVALWRVNVVLKTPDDEVPVPYVDDEGACDDTLTWYLSSPETVALCPRACDAVRSDESATLELVYGCTPHPTGCR